MKMFISLKYYLLLLLTLFSFLTNSIYSQKVIVIKKYKGKIEFDGILNEPLWESASSIEALTMVEPFENFNASHKTIVNIVVDEENIILGIICYDEPSKITAFSKARDVYLGNEDNIKFVFDTYCDKRNGYIFAINPFGARYDAAVTNRGERENSNWDGVWDAKTSINSDGWSAEIIIPVKTMSFKSDLQEWGFNIERRIERLLEKDRWSAIKRNYNVTSLSNAGLIKGLPIFDLGLGLLMKLSPIIGFHKNDGDNTQFDIDISGDITKRITPDISATLTVNTDFAETEVDSRRTNLTRFPLFFPEKRTFFLEGADIYDFGLGLGSDVIPFFSRKIGLYDGDKVPIVVGGKLNGKLGNTNFGGMYVHTGSVDSLVPATDLGVVRIKQNIFQQSNIGIIATSGDPNRLKNSWLIGADFTYQISDLFDDKNFLIGIWGLYSNRPDLDGDKTSFGIKIDYPNDLFDITASYKYIGDAFQPSLGFLPRTGIKHYRFGLDYMPRPTLDFIRQFFFESSLLLVTDLNNQWESYSIFTAPIHFLMESGDRFEFNIRPAGERLTEPFEIEDGVILPVGEYNYMRYRLEFETASKRPVSGEVTWWFGTFYSGTLNQIELSMSFRFTSNLILDLNYEKNIVDLREGAFQQDLFGGRIELNFSPNLQLSSFVQYDNESNSIGTNTRMRWTITPLTDLYVVYNHNINKITKDKWRFDSNQFILKLSYGLWY
ncbi:MAG: carbohydrate binding family 9 domain-containing protein [Melioribacteraceae bacterium]|nr:carbohydrate binding family 9 domain-containing protein [Melioribacteraceae bacterium]